MSKQFLYSQVQHLQSACVTAECSRDLTEMILCHISHSLINAFTNSTKDTATWLRTRALSTAMEFLFRRRLSRFKLIVLKVKVTFIVLSIWLMFRCHWSNLSRAVGDCKAAAHKCMTWDLNLQPSCHETRALNTLALGGLFSVSRKKNTDCGKVLKGAKRDYHYNVLPLKLKVYIWHILTFI